MENSRTVRNNFLLAFSSVFTPLGELPHLETADLLFCASVVFSPKVATFRVRHENPRLHTVCALEKPHFLHWNSNFSAWNPLLQPRGGPRQAQPLILREPSNRSLLSSRLTLSEISQPRFLHGTKNSVMARQHPSQSPLFHSEAESSKLIKLFTMKYHSSRCYG